MPRGHRGSGGFQVMVTEQQHARDDQVGREAEEEKRHVRSLAPAHVDHLEEGVHVGCLFLHLDGENSEEQDLRGVRMRVNPQVTIGKGKEAGG